MFGVWALNIYSSSAHLPGNNYGEYLVASYNGMNTAGGMLFGIISYPLMKFITTVGALAVVCAGFFAMLLISIFPAIKKDVTYVTVDVTKGEKRKRGSRMDKQRAPVITDLSAGGGAGSLYVVDVEGDPLSRNSRKNKGAEGYDPLYPNAGAQYEDELRSGDEDGRPDRFSSRSLARDILFSPVPEEDSLSRYKTVTNPDEALSSPGASYNAIRRNELRRKLGVDATDSMARDIVRERYFGDEKQNNAQRDASGIDPNARGASALGYTSFDALKADRTKMFGEMLSGTPSSSAASGNESGFGKPVSVENTDKPVKREVPKPAKQVQKPEIRREDYSKQTSASNMAGLHGSVSRAITGEEKAAPRRRKASPMCPHTKSRTPSRTPILQSKRRRRQSKRSAPCRRIIPRPTRRRKRSAECRVPSRARRSDAPTRSRARTGCSAAVTPPRRGWIPAPLINRNRRPRPFSAHCRRGMPRRNPHPASPTTTPFRPTRFPRRVLAAASPRAR